MMAVTTGRSGPGSISTEWPRTWSPFRRRDPLGHTDIVKNVSRPQVMDPVAYWAAGPREGGRSPGSGEEALAPPASSGRWGTPRHRPFVQYVKRLGDTPDFA